MNAFEPVWITAGSETVLLQIHVVPGARQNALVGQYGEKLKVRIAAQPEQGKANEELCRFFAKLLSLPVTAVRIVSGESSRGKTLAIQALSVTEVRQILSVALQNR